MTAVSFEFFPPRTEALEQTFWNSYTALSRFAPHFISLTYGAGGQTQERSYAILQKLQAEKAHNIAAHLTCVGASRDETDAVIASYLALGIKHFVALRGDMPDMQAYQPHAEGYTGSVALVEALREAGATKIAVSAYPEPHPESASQEQDLDLLRQKVAAGATQAITQFCFATETLLRLRDSIAKAGIAVELIPAIMPTTNFAGVANMAKKCGASLPAWLAKKYDGISALEDRRAIATEIASAQCAQLQEAGFAAVHFYTLNQANVVGRVCELCRLGENQ